jgi:hypothetical protein
VNVLVAVAVNVGVFVGIIISIGILFTSVTKGVAKELQRWQ